jgi:hypothetical protein
MNSESAVKTPAHNVKQSDTVSRQMYESLLQSRQKSNREREQLRAAIKDALAMMAEGDTENASVVLTAAYEATRLITLKSTDDCGCGES